jgi:hypothetical protein
MQALRQEVRSAEGTSQLQDWNMECKDLESRRQIGEFEHEMQKNEVSVLGALLSLKNQHQHRKYNSFPHCGDAGIQRENLPNTTELEDPRIASPLITSYRQSRGCHEQ